jgi:hypothetical protein
MKLAQTGASKLTRGSTHFNDIQHHYLWSFLTGTNRIPYCSSGFHSEGVFAGGYCEKLSADGFPFLSRTFPVTRPGQCVSLLLYFR